MVLGSMLDHVKSRWNIENKTEFDYILILFSGDAGTGKSRLQDGLRYVVPLRPYFMGATNVAGRVLRKIFMQNNIFASNFKVYNTTFQPYKLTPNLWAEHMANLYDGLPSNITSGTAKTPEEFWGGISKNLKRVSARIFEDGTSNRNLITPEEYANYRHYIKAHLKLNKRGQMSPREIHNVTMDHIASAVPSTRIPDQLMYNSVVVDEVGRIEVSWMIVEVGLWYHIHTLYNTGLTKPVYVAVGSCTQSSVINSTCFLGCSGDNTCAHPKIPINNFSAITALTQEGIIFMEDFFIKENKLNRRMVPSSATDKHAVLAVLRQCLEMNNPVPPWVYKIIKKEMTITEDVFYSYSGVLHLCPTHRECTEVLKRDIVDPTDVIPKEERMYSPGGSEWPWKLFNCTSAAGVMFKSANYISKEWYRKDINPETDLSFGVKLAFRLAIIDKDSGETIDILKQRRENQKKDAYEVPLPHPNYSAWTATRVFHRKRPYITSNTACCLFIGVSGGCKDFLTDLEEQEHMFMDNIDVYREVLSCLSSVIQTVFPENAGICKRILKWSALLTTLDEIVSAVNDLKSILKTLIKKQKGMSEVQEANEDEDIEIDFESCTWKRKPVAKKELFAQKDEVLGLTRKTNKEEEPPQIMIHYDCARSPKTPRLNVPKGEPMVLLGEVGKTGLKFRLGKTIELLLFPTATKVYQPPDKYQMNHMGVHRDSNSRKRNTKSEGSSGSDKKKQMKLMDEVIDDCDLDEEELASINSELKQLNMSEAVAAQTMREEISGETRVGRSRFFTVLEMYPVKINLQRTVASSQGMTYGAMIFGKINNVIDANTFIVICTRSVSPDNLKFLFPSHGGDPTVLPLDNVVVETNKKMHILSDQTGSGYV